MRLLKTLFLVLILGLVGVFMAAGFFYDQLVVKPLPVRTPVVEFTLPPGTGLSAAAELISDAGVGIPAWQLALLGRAMGRASQIKAGSYEINTPTTAVELIDMLTRGDVRLAKLTLVEGKTWREWRAMLDAHPDLAHDSQRLSDAQLRQQLGITAPALEGQFLPDTYLFAKNSSDLDVLRRAHHALQRQLDRVWATRDPQLRVNSPWELLILASIVEKETGLPADRPKVAAVFANRLRQGMPLQTDPTVIYGLGANFDGNLRKIDLLTDTPWNTYTRSGLPATPICMPGIKALEVTSRPANTNDVYFVARGDGSSEFSATLDAHNRAVNKYQR